MSKRLLDLLAGSPFLLYLTTRNNWGGPFQYQYISTEGETVGCANKSCQAPLLVNLR